MLPGDVEMCRLLDTALVRLGTKGMSLAETMALGGKSGFQVVEVMGTI